MAGYQEEGNCLSGRRGGLYYSLNMEWMVTRTALITYHQVAGDSFNTVGCLDPQTHCVRLALGKSKQQGSQDDSEAKEGHWSRSLDPVAHEDLPAGGKQGPGGKYWYAVLSRTCF